MTNRWADVVRPWTFWINIYPHGRGAFVYDRREQAIEADPTGTAIYRIKVTFKR